MEMARCLALTDERQHLDEEENGKYKWILFLDHVFARLTRKLA
jgi:hypothetical protein